MTFGLRPDSQVRRYAMVFDIERHQENRMKFLAALYESGTEYESIIGQKAGLSSEDTDRIGTELLDERLVFGETGDGVHGPWLTLEPPGRALIEKYLYEKSILAKKRKAGDWVKEKGVEAAMAGASQFGKWIIGGVFTIIVSMFAAYRWTWISWLLGLR